MKSFTSLQKKTKLEELDIVINRLEGLFNKNWRFLSNEYPDICTYFTVILLLSKPKTAECLHFLWSSVILMSSLVQDVYAK